jgi:hypothetical protein
MFLAEGPYFTACRTKVKIVLSLYSLVQVFTQDRETKYFELNNNKIFRILYTSISILNFRATRYRRWLRPYATCWKVAGSSPDEVMALGFTQSLTEMSMRKSFLGVKRGRRVGLTI